MKRRLTHRPLVKGSKREGITDPDAPPILHSGPVDLGWEGEVEPHDTGEPSARAIKRWQDVDRKPGQ